MVSLVLDMDIIWMRYAIILAKIAFVSGNVPIGAILVYDGRIIGYGYNYVTKCYDPSAHAEIIALRIGGRILRNYRLLNSTLYVTLEPCMMCVGAMVHARIYRLVCGARDNKFGFLNLWSIFLVNTIQMNHRFFIKTGVLARICSEQINNFFRLRR